MEEFFIVKSATDNNKRTHLPKNTDLYQCKNIYLLFILRKKNLKHLAFTQYIVLSRLY